MDEKQQVKILGLLDLALIAVNKANTARKIGAHAMVSMHLDDAIDIIEKLAKELDLGEPE